MNYFARENANLRRIDYKNTYKIDNEVEKLKNVSKSNHFYNRDHEYAVIWYGREFKSIKNADDAVVYIEVELINLTQPTYTMTDRATNRQTTHSSYIKIEVPINYLHKLPIGSIWKDGRSKQRFDFSRHERIEVSKNNYRIYSIGRAVNYEQRRLNGELLPDEEEYPLPFDYESYYDRIYKFDKNQLIIIHHNDLKYVIHPILLFITHYGYSMDVKRILTKYGRNDIREKLAIFDTQLDRLARQQGCNEYVIIPRGMTQRDAVFLHHYKYDTAVNRQVNRLSDVIQLAKRDNTQNIKIDFWHLPITLNLTGIKVGDTVFCTAITGISEPNGNTINLLLQPKRKVNIDKDNESDFITVIPFTPPHNIEELDLDFVRDPVNNIAVQLLTERLERIGELRDINRFQLEREHTNGQIQYVPRPVPEQFGIGDLRGQAGKIGLAKCFFEVKDAENPSRFDKIWKHAKEYAREIGSPAQWFSYEQGFKTTDQYYVMSLKKFHNPAYGLELPENVLVIAFIIDGVSYYVLEFGEVIYNGKIKEFRGIVYRADKNEDFLYSITGLPLLLFSIVDQNGTLSYDFADKYRGKLAFFMHRDAQGNNWVRNGIERVRQK